jgi:UDP-N-acetylglucosamine:LPS N-acetylglucosamine transferase
VTAPRVVVAGGHSAGHIEPTMNFADALRRLEPTAEITALGTVRGLDTTLIPARGYPLELIPPVPLPRKLNRALLQTPGRLRGPEYAGLHDQTRRLSDQFLALCLTVADGPQQAVELMAQLLAQAHGYATFFLDGVFSQEQYGYARDLVVRKSIDAARTVIKGHLNNPT